MILVTGGTGFLGSHLVCRLVKDGCKVRVLHRRTSDFSIFNRVAKYNHLTDPEINRFVDWEEADILDPYRLEEVVNDISVIYHCAGMVSFQPGDGKRLNKININGTANLINAALQSKVQNFCHVSSTAAIGRADHELIIDERVIWKNSNRNSRYAVSKYGAEREVWRGIAEGLNAVIVNPSIILGPGEVNSGSTRMIRVVDKGLYFYTPGSNGFVDVRDVVNIMIKLINGNIFNERFIISSENVTYKELFSYMAKYLHKPAPKFAANGFLSEITWRLEHARHYIFGSKPLITRETARTARVFYAYSNEKIRQAIDYQFIPIEKCIADSCRFYLADKNND
ncbi:MAG: NAD-dependent epimerase/dehydratase family protein [Bacteroidales bacterium]|nr:NAD-dependent epimerase/dehydratase family protein [Bacteroidales bacterium]